MYITVCMKRVRKKFIQTYAIVPELMVSIAVVIATVDVTGLATLSSLVVISARLDVRCGVA